MRRFSVFILILPFDLIPKAMFAARRAVQCTHPKLVSRAASGIALKYANAAYGAALAQSPQTLTKVGGELASISTALKSQPKLAEYITNPTLSKADKASGLSAVFAAAEGTGAKKAPVSEITKNLFAVLSENGRLAESQGVIDGFAELVSKYKGELEVVVTSAQPLPRDVMTRIEASLKTSQVAQKAKTVKITNKASLLRHRIVVETVERC